MQVYKLFEVNNNLLRVKDTFKSLPADPYLKDSYKFRDRRYSTGKFSDGTFEWGRLPQNTFLQSKATNSYLGGVERIYEPLSNEAKRHVKKVLLPNIISTLPLCNYEIGIHQIRVHTNSSYVGYPAPEGIHQDGFDYVCISVVSVVNCVGGTNLLFGSADEKNIIGEYALKEGECLLLDDKSLYHYASPIVPKLPGAGYRDVFIVTLLKLSTHDVVLEGRKEHC